MRCIGITKKISRCRNDAKSLYCGFHKWQPVTFVVSFLSFLGLIAGIYQDAFNPFLAWVFPKESEKVEISLIENDPRFHISKDFDKSSSIVSGITNRYSGFQVNKNTGLHSHGVSFDFMLYAQPTQNVAKEPLLIEGIYLVVDHSEEDVVYTFPHGPREKTHYYVKEMVLEPGKNRYEISSDQFKLQEGQSDSFRIKIDSNANLRYVVHVEVTWWRPSSPSQRETFKSRQYQISFPEVRRFSDLLMKNSITAMHVSADQLFGLIGFEGWPKATKSHLVPRVILPGFHFYYPERRGAGSPIFNFLNTTNPFFDWWKKNPQTVYPGGYSLYYDEVYTGEPHFMVSYIIFDDSFVLLNNRGDYATLYNAGVKFQTISDHFEENWARGRGFANKFPDVESFVKEANQAVSSQNADLDLVYVSRFFPSTYSADLLTTAFAFSDQATKNTALESLKILGLGHKRGPIIKNLHKHLQKSYSDSEEEAMRRAIQEILEHFDLPVSSR